MRKQKIEEQIFKCFRKKICSAYHYYENKGEPFSALCMIYGTVSEEGEKLHYRIHSGQSLKPVGVKKLEKVMKNRSYEIDDIFCDDDDDDGWDESVTNRALPREEKIAEFRVELAKIKERLQAKKSSRKNKVGSITVVVDHERKVIKHSYVFGPTWGMGEEIPFRVEQNKVIIDYKNTKRMWVS